MDEERKAKIRTAVRMFAGFCTEDVPEDALTRIVDALLEGDLAKAEAVADESSDWVAAWEEGWEKE